ncbi:MAG: GNAT family N-acetyltransferase [Oscillospiraceae bacterium]|nr:GNAT family N-acetyltransferase [Oscillospiraceae bacterium]
MEHKGTVTLETPRLWLRRLCPEDAEAAYRNWTADAQVTRFLTWKPHESLEATRRLFAEWCARYADPMFYQWGIVPKLLGEPVGSISVVRYLEEGSCAELGWCIGRDWWGQGITVEALAAVLRYLFWTVGMPEVGACHDVNNPNSGRVMQKCGLHYRMTLSGQGTNNLGICDLARYSLTLREYDTYKLLGRG